VRVFPIYVSKLQNPSQNRSQNLANRNQFLLMVGQSGAAVWKSWRKMAPKEAEAALWMGCGDAEM